MHRVRSATVSVLFTAAVITPTTWQPPAVANDGAAEPVVLTEFTTETTEVQKLPDGTLEMTAHRDAVRVEQGNQWVDVDTTLSVGADGRIAPAATTVDVSFSPGGPMPAVELADDEGSLDISWPHTLPEPELDGDAATYRDVRPGIDLVLRATPSGFAQTLVIEDKPAALALAGDPVELTVTSPDLEFSSSPDGSTAATNSTNETVFTSPPAVMWDSSGPETPTADTPHEGAISPADATADADDGELRIVLAPNEEAIASSETEYPIFLDPVMTRDRNHYLTVHSRGWDYYDDANQPMRVGYCGWATCNDSYQATAQSFMSFEIDPLAFNGADPVIYDATVSVLQVHNATTASQPVNLRRATAIKKSDTYPGPVGAQLQQISSAGGGGSNPDAGLLFSNEAVRSYVEEKAAAEAENIQFGLIAPNPTDRDQWKKFHNNPVLTVKYGFKPTTPTTSVRNSLICTGQPTTVTSGAITATSVASTRGPGGLPLRHFFEIYTHPRSSGEAPFRQGRAADVGSGATATWSPASSLPNGRYVLRTMATVVDLQTTNTDSDWSEWFTFTVDTTKPPAPKIWSATHPPASPGAAVSAPTTFLPESGSETTAYSWGLDTTPQDPGNTICSLPRRTTTKTGYISAGEKITFAPGELTAGRHVLNVRSLDDAHNDSAAMSSYEFDVAPDLPSSGTEVPDRTNLIEVESLAPAALTPGAAVTPTPWPGTGNAASLVTGPGGTTTTVVDYPITPKLSGYQSLGLRFGRRTDTGSLRASLVDPGSDASSEDDIEHLLLDDSGTRAVVHTSGPATGTRSEVNGFMRLADFLPQEGLLMFKDRTYTLRVELTGTAAILDSLVIAPVRREDFASLSSAFDNLAGGTTTGATGFDLTTAGTKAFSRTAMTAQGIVPGNTLSVPIEAPDNLPPTLPAGYDPTSVEFTIPALGTRRDPVSGLTTPADNVVSMGQTITAGQYGTSGYNVYLLATSTCGPIASGTSRALSIKYDVAAGTQPSHVDLMTVPDWLSDDPVNPLGGISGKIGMTHHLDGAATVAHSSSLYVLRFPIHEDYWDKRVLNVTLPQVGTTYNNAPCGQPGSQALHIFGMAIK